MEEFFSNHYDKGLPGQVFVILGPIKSVVSELKDILNQKEGIESLESSADHFLKFYELFSVEDARDIKKAEGVKGFDGGKRFFIIAANGFTTEAQNALLKVVEEPKDGHYIFIITPSKSGLLPTLLSRVVIIEGERLVESDVSKMALDFLTATAPKRLKIVDKMLPKDSKDKEGLNQKILDFLSALESSLYDEIKKSKNGKNIYKKLEKFSTLKDYVRANMGASRLVLEFLALNL